MEQIKTAQKIQCLRDKKIILDMQSKVMQSDVEPKTKFEVFDWLQKTYEELAPLTN